MNYSVRLGFALLVVCLLGGCPPPVPSVQCKQDPSLCPCAFELNEIRSMKLSPEAGTLHIPQEQMRSIAVDVEASTVQRPALFCVGLLAGNLPSNRLTDHQLGGTFLLLTDPGRYVGSMQARCSDSGIEFSLFPKDSSSPAWVTTNTRENGVYAVSLPPGLFSPASNVMNIKCD